MSEARIILNFFTYVWQCIPKPIYYLCGSFLSLSAFLVALRNMK